jgi:hypothetical protein
MRWTTLGVERHVDLWMKRRSVHSLPTGHSRGPHPPAGVRASAVRPLLGVRLRSQRQRMDMISPATMAPKPMAKFHADSETMKGIRSPAT